MKSYNYILFDWDGCLAQTLDIALKAYKTTFAKYGLFPSDTQIANTVFGDWNGAIKVGIAAKDNDTFTQEFLSAEHAEFPHALLFPGALELLEALKSQHKKLALITTSDLDSITPPVTNNNVKKYFDVILTKEDVIH